MIKPWEMLGIRRDVRQKQVTFIQAHKITQIQVAGALPVDEAIEEGAVYDPTFVPNNLFTRRLSYVPAGIQWIDPGKIMFGQVPPGPELGDLVLRLDFIFESLMQAIQDSDYSYLYVNGRTVRPREIIVNTVEGDSSLEVRCELVNLVYLETASFSGMCDGTGFDFSCPENSGHLLTAGIG